MADAARCISRRSALRFWEEKCGVNGLGCRGLHNWWSAEDEELFKQKTAVRY